MSAARTEIHIRGRPVECLIPTYRTPFADTGRDAQDDLERRRRAAYRITERLLLRVRLIICKRYICDLAATIAIAL